MVPKRLRHNHNRHFYSGSQHDEYSHPHRLFYRRLDSYPRTLEYDAGRTWQYIPKTYADAGNCAGSNGNCHCSCCVFVTLATLDSSSVRSLLANQPNLSIFGQDISAGRILSFGCATRIVRPMKKFLTLLLTTASLTVGTTVFASDTIIDEVRFGGTWAQPEWMDANHTEGDQAGINAQILLNPFDIDLFDIVDDGDSGFLHSLMNPRPNIGAMVNLDEDGTSYITAGWVWQFELTETFFFEAGFGGGWNNGSDVPTATRAGIGSKWLFNESLAFGANISENMTVVVQWDHLSHRDFAGDMNRGLNNISARIGFKF